MELNKNRLFFLDWLRVISIFLVFLHHVAMPFNGQSWLADYQGKSESLYSFTVFFEQWRLNLLFLISGAGTYLAFSKRTALQYFGERTQRLLIPLYFGIFFIVPPQTYYQFYNNYDSFWDLYPNVFFDRQLLHLWFLKMLYAFSVVIIPLILYLKSEKVKLFKASLSRLLENAWAIFTLGLIFVLIGVIAKKKFPENPDAFLTNYGTSVPFFLYFLTGIILSSNPKSWEKLFELRKTFLFFGLIGIVLFYYFFFVKEHLVHSGRLTEDSAKLIWDSIRGFMGWSVILTVISFGVKYLNKTNKWLRPLNEGIYPFYILHQTIIIIIAFYVIQLNLIWQFKILIVLFSSLFLSIGVYRFLIYPIKPLWYFFGLKPNKKAQTKNSLKEVV